MFDYSGRFWINSKIISFWDYPETKQILFDLLNKINEKMELIYHIKVDFSDFQIEIVKQLSDNPIDIDYVLIDIKNYTGSKDLSDDVLNAPHLLPPDEKKKHPQMIAAKRNDIDLKGKKENSWRNLARRDFYLKKDIAEKIKK